MIDAAAPSRLSGTEGGSACDAVLVTRPSQSVDALNITEARILEMFLLESKTVTEADIFFLMIKIWSFYLVFSLIIVVQQRSVEIYLYELAAIARMVDERPDLLVSRVVHQLLPVAAALFTLWCDLYFIFRIVVDSGDRWKIEKSRQYGKPDNIVASGSFFVWVH